MKKLHKDIARYVILAIVMVGAADLVDVAAEFNQNGNLSNAFAGIVGVYLATWGFIVKFFFQTRTTDVNDVA